MELAQAEVARSSKEHVRLQQELQRAEIEKSRSNQNPNPKPKTQNPKPKTPSVRCRASAEADRAVVQACGGGGGGMQGGLLFAVFCLRFGLVLSGPFLLLQRTPNFNSRLI